MSLVLDFREEVTLFRGDLEEMRRRLDVLEGGYMVLIRAATFAVDTLRPIRLSLSAHLWRFLEQVERAMELGICRGGMLALATVDLHSGHNLRQLGPRFLDGTTLQECEELLDYFAGATEFIAAKMDVGDLLQKGLDMNIRFP